MYCFEKDKELLKLITDIGFIKNPKNTNVQHYHYKEYYIKFLSQNLILCANNYYIFISEIKNKKDLDNTLDILKEHFSHELRKSKIKKLLKKKNVWDSIKMKLIKNFLNLLLF